MKFFVVTGLFLSFFAGASVFANTGTNADRPRALHRDQIFDVSEYGAGWTLIDRNRDGTVDYAAMFDARNRKVIEAIDHNHDGFMDNFYFFEGGILVRQEIDTNNNGRVDLWVFLSDGIYVRKYERDTNHDGIPDVIRLYDAKE